MTLSNYVQLGNSDLKVSPLCLGTMTFGEDWGKGSNVKESNEILHQYINI
jgi:aryl-alcohol dehydrogenase-like predicted oxidoreductase